MTSIIPSVKRRRSIDWETFAAVSIGLTGGLMGGAEPEALRRQREILNAMEAEAFALYRIEQKHPKRLEDKRYICQSDVRANCQCQQCREGRELRNTIKEAQ